MRIDGLDLPGSTSALAPEAKKPQTPEAAAKQFEQVLIKQMVKTMTEGLFDGNLTGDDAPQWMGAYGEMQGDILADELAMQLSRSGRLGISELLIKQWKREGEMPAPADDARPQESSVEPGASIDPIRGTGPVNPFTEI